jgi:hypothetical protein
MQHPHLGVFTCREFIWIVNFKFGVHKVETTYIPSNWMQNLIDMEERCSNANCKFTRRQLQRNERGKLLYPRWDSYFEFSKFWILNTNRTSLFWNHLFFQSPIFLHNIIFRHSLSLFELLSCKYNCSFSLEIQICNLLALTKDMVFKKKPLDKRGKKNLERKIKNLCYNQE